MKDSAFVHRAAAGHRPAVRTDLWMHRSSVPPPRDDGRELAVFGRNVRPVGKRCWAASPNPSLPRSPVVTKTLRTLAWVERREADRRKGRQPANDV